MNPRQLRYFLQVANSGSITMAAGVLHIAQPALSRQIQHLEDDMGVALFRRSHKGIALTQAGELLQQRASALILHYESVVDEVKSQSDSAAHLSIVLPPSMHEFITLPLAEKVLSAFGSERVKINESADSVIDITTWLETAQTHLAVIGSGSVTSAVESHPLLSEPFFVIGPTAAGFRIDSPVSVRELASLPLAIASRPNLIRSMVERLYAEEQRLLKIAIEVNSRSLILDLAERGVAYSLLPYCGLAHRLSSGLISAAPVAGLAVDWVMVRSKHRYFPEIGWAVEQMIREIADERIKAGAWASAHTFQAL